jgi:hypothetical protein
MRIRTTLLINEDLWRDAKRLTRSGKPLHAAIAYFGQKGAALLPFRRGDQLVVATSALPASEPGAPTRENSKN